MSMDIEIVKSQFILFTYKHLILMKKGIWIAIISAIGALGAALISKCPTEDKDTSKSNVQPFINQKVDSGKIENIGNKTENYYYGDNKETPTIKKKTISQTVIPIVKDLKEEKSVKLDEVVTITPKGINPPTTIQNVQTSNGEQINISNQNQSGGKFEVNLNQKEPEPKATISDLNRILDDINPKIRAIIQERKIRNLSINVLISPSNFKKLIKLSNDLENNKILRLESLNMPIIANEHPDPNEHQFITDSTYEGLYQGYILHFLENYKNIKN
jgi:hypothetical protein